MKHQSLFSSKDKTKKIKVSSAAILLGALRVKIKGVEMKIKREFAKIIIFDI